MFVDIEMFADNSQYRCLAVRLVISIVEKQVDYLHDNVRNE
jgi:hypothetical protein